MTAETSDAVPTPDYARRVPNAPKTKNRNVRISDGLWLEVQQAAEDDGKTVSDVVREGLRLYLAQRPKRGRRK